MEEKTNEIENLFHQAVDYSKTSLEIIKLKTVDKTADVGASLITRIMYLIISAICLMVLSLGGSFWLGEILGKIYYGFLIVAGFWAVTGIFLYIFMNKPIKKMFRNSIIRKAFKAS
jgi:hypothetical protein